MGKLQQQFANKKLKKLHDFHLTLSTQPCVKIDRRRSILIWKLAFFVCCPLFAAFISVQIFRLLVWLPMIKFVDGDTKRTPDRMFFVNVLTFGPCFSHVNVHFM